MGRLGTGRTVNPLSDGPLVAAEVFGPNRARTEALPRAPSRSRRAEDLPSDRDYLDMVQQHVSTSFHAVQPHADGR